MVHFGTKVPLPGTDTSQLHPQRPQPRMPIWRASKREYADNGIREWADMTSQRCSSVPAGAFVAILLGTATLSSRYKSRHLL